MAPCRMARCVPVVAYGLALSLFCGDALAQERQPPAGSGQPVAGHADPKESRSRDWLITAAALAVAAGADAVIDPRECRWCDRDVHGRDTLSGFDGSVRSALRWSDLHLRTAGALSDVTVYAPLSLLFIDRHHDVPTRALFALEALAVTSLGGEAIKLAAARQRPYVHFAAPQSDASTAHDANTSFLSAHSASAVTLVVSMVRTCRMDQNCAYEKQLWWIGSPIALTTMWLRIAADRHYMTDVLAGAGLGAAVGWWLPRRQGHRAHQPAILPIARRHGAGLRLDYHW